MMIRRRTALLGLAATVALGNVSLALAEAGTRKRFVVVILRGALDGLSTVVPYGDANLRAWRASLLLPEPGKPDGVLDMGGFWGLHPQLKRLHALYGAGEMLPVHAAAGPTRSRSHFEAQDLLECGAGERMDTGWLNRLAGLLPPAPGENDRAVALGQTVPLLLRGPLPVNSWAPGGKPDPGVEFYGRLAAMHEADKLTGPAMADGLRQRGIEGQALAGAAGPGGDAPFVTLARAAGRFLADPKGPRLAALELDGWDTHSNQTFRLKYALMPLDAGLAALKESLGPAWADTVVVVMTEFGRTVRVNGTLGTDHGTATVAFVLGGGVRGGRVLADWPGLAENKLFENRDLAPTTDLRGVIKGLLAGHYGLGPDALTTIFPESQTIAPAAGLLRA